MSLDISIVIPVKDEADNIAELLREIMTVLTDRPAAAFEVIFVDDGSEDGTWDVIRGLAEDNAELVRGIRLRRNFGKAHALAVGFDRASGAVVFTMDGDLQDDPAEIPRFLELIDQGYDVVSGWKRDRQDPLEKRLPSRLFNQVTARLSGVPIHDFNCGFKAYRAEVLENIVLYGELHRYIPVLANHFGFRVGEIVVNHRKRTHGRSKYGLERYIRGFLDLITVLVTTRYAVNPSYFFGGIGISVGLVGGLILTYLAMLWLFGMGPIGQRPLFFVGVLLVILSAQILSVGVLSEIITRHSATKPPDITVKETC